jgi:hypothetical protein
MATKKAPIDVDAEGGKAALGRHALTNKKVMKSLLDALGGPDRAQRSLAAGALHEVACTEPKALVPYGDALVDALDRPEVHTRWEVLGVLEELVAVDTRLVEKAVPAAIECLHDTESAVVRVAAYRLLATFGATTERRAARVWPLLSDAARIYHGDPEYSAMLAAVVKLLEGAAGDPVKKAAAELFESDLTSPDRSVSRRAKRIAALKPKRARKKA